MSEPTATPAEIAPSAMTPDQATAEIAQIRGDTNHDWHHEGRPGFDAAHERVMQLYQRAHSSAEPSGEPGAAPPDENTRRPNIVDDGPHAIPQTAAELDAVPLPAGLDPVMSKAVNVLAEREGVTAFVLEGRHVIAGALSGPPVDAVQAERQLQQRWGRMFPSKLEAAHLAFDALPPDVRADLERRELDLHPAFMDYLARVGEALMDASTPGGERRLRAKYAQAESRPNA
jgi:hypothetical protein